MSQDRNSSLNSVSGDMVMLAVRDNSIGGSGGGVVSSRGCSIIVVETVATVGVEAVLLRSDS